MGNLAVAMRKTRPGLRSDKSCQPWKLLLADCVCLAGVSPPSCGPDGRRCIAARGKDRQHAGAVGSGSRASGLGAGLDPAPMRPRMGAVSRGCPNHSVTKAARRIRTGTPFAWVGPVWEPLAGSSSLDARIDLKRAHALRHAIHKRRSRGAIGRIIQFVGPFVERAERR
jgi:hypothetical protein